MSVGAEHAGKCSLFRAEHAWKCSLTIHLKSDKLSLEDIMIINIMIFCIAVLKLYINKLSLN